jgi:hypothetical protein
MITLTNFTEAFKYWLSENNFNCSDLSSLKDTYQGFITEPIPKGFYGVLDTKVLNVKSSDDYTWNWFYDDTQLPENIIKFDFYENLRNMRSDTVKNILR